MLKYLFLLLFSPNLLFGQDASKIKNYYDTLNLARHDTDIIHAYSMLCFHYASNNPDSAVHYGEKGLLLSKKIKHERAEANISNSLGWAYFKQHRYTEAENLFNKALHTWEITGERNREAKVMNNLAQLFMDKGDYAKSLSYMQRVLNLDDSLQDLHTKAIDLHTTGRLYNLMKDFKEARIFFEDAFKISQQLKDEVGQGRELMSIGNTFVSEKKYNEAIPYYKKCIAIYNNVFMPIELGLAYENAAGAYFGIKQYDRAFEYINLAIINYEKLKSRTDLYYAWLSRGEMEYEINLNSNAAESFLKAYNLAIELDDKNLQYPIMEKLADAKSRAGDFKSAYQLYTNAQQIKDSVLTIENQHELLKLKTAFDTERKEKENVLLKAQNDAAQLKLQRNTVLLISSLFLLIALGALSLSFYRNKESKAKHIAELEILNQQLLVQKEEISRINAILELKALRARMNPHFIFNCMSSIQECMLTNRISDANSYLTKLSRLLRMVLMHSDDESITLKKESEILELYLQLESLRLKDGFSFTIQCDQDIDTADVKVPALLLQPFAENAIWHGLVHKSSDRKILIRIDEKDNMLHCIVEDNGIGRQAANQLNSKRKNHQSLGLSMTERRLSILNEQSGNNNSKIIIHDLVDADGGSIGTSVELFLPLLYV